MDAWRDHKPHEPAPVKFLVALTYREQALVKQALQDLQPQVGSVETQGEPFSFRHTDYYEAEMGKNLEKCFCSFGMLARRNQLVDFKIRAMAIERKLAIHGRRRINIDPAYLELPKLVVATSKNFSHRIYLDKGVFGDVQLMYQQGHFVSNPWTYADYKTDDFLTFLSTVRSTYAEQLKTQ